MSSICNVSKIDEPFNHGLLTIVVRGLCVYNTQSIHVYLCTYIEFISLNFRLEYVY